MRPLGAARAAAAFIRTRRLAARWRRRSDVERWQAARLRRWLTRRAVAVPAYAALAERAAAGGLAALPVIDKAALLADFAAFNRLGLSADDAFAMIERGESPPGHALGASTGTSGNRAPYLVSDAERFTWLGTMLAKALPNFLGQRVAVVLPRGSGLYDAAGQTRALRLLHVPIGDGLDRMARALERFDPTVVVAPPRALRWMAERGTAIAPRRVFSAAEVLDPLDRAAIEGRFGPVGQIYMATEGLLAVSCARGTLHLAEDCVHIELEPAGGGLVSPIVTDFTRTAQIMARYRMNDLLRMRGDPCPCGSPMRAVAEVVGRRDDAFELPGPRGAVTVTPDVLRDAVVGASRAISDFRAIQRGRRTVTLHLHARVPERCAEAALAALRRAIERAGGQACVSLVRGPLEPRADRKLRRVERRP